MYGTMMFVLGFLCALVGYSYVHLKFVAFVQEVDLKYQRLLDILQEWQKNI